MHRYPYLPPRRAGAAILPLLLMTTIIAAAGPLHDHDNGPLTGIYGFPDSSEGGRLVVAGGLRSDLTAITASHSVEEQTGTERLSFDGETTRLELTLRYGLSERLEVGVELPWVWHESGSLDAVIDSWHDWFGLPDGNRDEQPRDALEFFYQPAAAVPLSLTASANGPGDVRLLAGYRLVDTARKTGALRLGVKLPTGDSDLLLGSGGVDVSVGYAAEYDELGAGGRYSAFYSASATWLGDAALAFDRQRRVVGRLAGGVGWRVSPLVELRAQAALRSAVYDSDTDNLGAAAAMLTVGGHLHVSRSVRVSIAVGEDIRPGSAPDVSFQLSVSYRPD